MTNESWNEYGTRSPMAEGGSVSLTYSPGNRRHNTNPDTLAQGLIGWACTVGGAPGTWIELWAIACPTGDPSAIGKALDEAFRKYRQLTGRDIGAKQ